MQSKAWPAPAKLNLCLHIIGRRADGYHLLQTAFQFIDLIDEINFNVLGTGQVRRLSDMPDVHEQDDLTVRAANALKEHSGCDLGVEIDVSKRIPAGGGLGGGSSDAATTLVALNQLWDTGLDKQQLLEVGLSLGADVPVFIHQQAAWAEGVGEQLTSIEPEENWYLVIHPGCHVETGTVFNAPDLTRNSPAITIRDFLESGGINDCEAVVRQLYPEVNEALDWLSQYAPAQLTGTGACVFASFAEEVLARKVQQSLPAEWQGYTVQGLNKSPLQQRLAAELDASV